MNEAHQTSENSLRIHMHTPSRKSLYMYIHLDRCPRWRVIVTRAPPMCAPFAFYPLWRIVIGLRSRCMYRQLPPYIYVHIYIHIYIHIDCCPKLGLFSMCDVWCTVARHERRKIGFDVYVSMCMYMYIHIDCCPKQQQHTHRLLPKLRMYIRIDCCPSCVCTYT